MTKTWIVRWEGNPEEYPFHDFDDLEDVLFHECLDLIDQCEQEILDGGHWDDTPDGDRIRSDTWNEAWLDLLPRVTRAYNLEPEEMIVIPMRPAYAVAQREAYCIYVTCKEED